MIFPFLKILFNPLFLLLKQHFTTKVKGSGLGLAIVEKTVNELNGSLHIESREGVGTKVSISLPLK